MKSNDFLNVIDYRLTEASSNKMLLVMTGIGGTVCGYKNKYSIIAKEMKEKYNISTLIIALSVNAWNYMKDIFNFAVQYIKKYYKKLNIDDYQIYAMGTSAGATNILNNMNECSNITKVCVVNPVFPINIDKTLENIKNCQIKKTIILGEYDISVADFKRLAEIKNVEIVLIPEGDHYLSGDKNFQFFLDIPKQYFIES